MQLEKGNIKLISFPVGSYQCNCSIIYSKKSKEALIIDPGNDHLFLLNTINKLGLKPTKLLHTHAHFDHIGRSNEIRKQTGATIHLHKGDQFLYDMLPEQGKYFGQTVGTPEPLDAYLNDDETFSFIDGEINNFLKTIHTPGHTPGSCCFYSEYFDVPTLFSGDTLFQRSIGRTDLPGGDTNQILQSIKNRLFTLPDETLVTPGHGGDTRVFEEKKLNPFFA